MPRRSDSRPPAPPQAVPPADGLFWAVLDAGPATDAAMVGRGLHRVRTLVQLRRSLPLHDADRAGVPPIVTRAFDADRDTDALLEVNNAAFSWHPEQGGWDRARLADALAEPWVDPAGLLVHDGPDEAVDGFCWTRVHHPEDPDHPDDAALGEIYVIAAAPNRHGTRLGPALVIAGLDHLAEQGLRVAILFTEEGNLPARRMYDRLGFSVHERRGGYR